MFLSFELGVSDMQLPGPLRLGTDMCDVKQGWRQEFSDEGLILPTRGLKYSFQGTINAKNLRKNRFSPSDGS